MIAKRRKRFLKHSHREILRTMETKKTNSEITNSCLRKKREKKKISRIPSQRR